MIELVAIGFVAGTVAAISPCVLPVLPVILVAGVSTPGAGRSGPADGEGRRRSWWRRQARPVSVVAGLVLSFSLVILAGSEIISLLGLPQGFLRDAGIVVLVAVGVSFAVPGLATVLERPFSRLTTGRQPDGRYGGFVMGFGVGLLFVPCAGPILAAITVAGATHRVGWTSLALTVAFAAGTAVPLLVMALAGSALAQRTAALRRHAARIRTVSGVVVVAMAVAISLNVFAGVQRDVPGYTSALQRNVEGGSGVRRQLSALGAHGAAGPHRATLASCSATAAALIDCGPAPDFAGITAWLDTPGGRPLTLAQLRGKVVLVDFWTYSCINCQRTLPHVEAWYRDYQADGLVVVGVHTPEFGFEHVVANVRNQAAALGVRYPVAVDDGYRTWDAYSNEYWPADYLIDARGEIRHVSFGEGGYGTTEALIRQLLTAADPGRILPAATDDAGAAPAGTENPETYLGYQQEQYIVNDTLARDSPAVYTLPPSVPFGGVALAGTWTDGAEEATAGPGAELQLGYADDDVYLVMGGAGTVEVSVGGRHTRTISVGGVPKLYTLVHGDGPSSGVIELKASPGVEAYDFTFG